jgi:hypothetical protein
MTGPDPIVAQMLAEFDAGHSSAAHGIARVLLLIADTYRDPNSWDVVSRQTLRDLAARLTA